MEMIYIKRERKFSMLSKTDLVKYNECYNNMIINFEK